ncbi:MAG: hypothetical protein IJJ34_10130 [Clostridia bacterium]|nr:hypothetical protein [Clostridia bacterium]
MSAILVIDTGSSSMRGILYAEDGSSIHMHQEHYLMKTWDNAAEYDPKDFETALVRICRNCSVFAQKNGIVIDAVSFTSQRSSTLPVDRSGHPLAPIMTWYDKRASGICDRMNAVHKKTLFETAGMQASPVLSAPKIVWLLENRPDLYDAAYKIIGIQDYLIFLCTGIIMTDASLASRSNLMDISTKTWSSDLLHLYGIDARKLADLYPPCSVVGPVSSEFSKKTGLSENTSVIAAGGDQQCSVLGQGLFRPGDSGITCGSGSYVASIIDAPLTDPLLRLNTNVAIGPGQWVLEASTLSSGTVQDWFLRTFYPGIPDALHVMQTEAQTSPPGANGLVMLPDLAGKGAPDWDNYAKGVFWNVSFSVSRSDFSRAMLEGLCAEIAECHEVLHDLDPRVCDVHVTGGLSRFPLFNQILADMIGSRVSRVPHDETTSIGAYMAALLALKRVNSLEEAYSCIMPADATEPYSPDPAAAILYRKAAERRRLLYSSIPSRALSAQ